MIPGPVCAPNIGLDTIVSERTTRTDCMRWRERRPPRREHPGMEHRMSRCGLVPSSSMAASPAGIAPPTGWDRPTSSRVATSTRRRTDGSGGFGDPGEQGGDAPGSRHVGQRRQRAVDADLYRRRLTAVGQSPESGSFGQGGGAAGTNENPATAVPCRWHRDPAAPFLCLEHAGARVASECRRSSATGIVEADNRRGLGPQASKYGPGDGVDVAVSPRRGAGRRTPDHALAPVVDELPCPRPDALRGRTTIPRSGSLLQRRTTSTTSDDR